MASESLNGVIQPYDYEQPLVANAIPANGYPSGAAACSITVRRFGNANWVIQELTTWGTVRKWARSTNNAGTSWSTWREFSML